MNPGDMGSFRQGVPFRYLAKGSTGGLDLFRQGTPFRGLIAGAVTYTATASGGIQVGGVATVSVTVGPGPGGWPLVGGGPTTTILVKQGGPAMGYLGDIGVGQPASDTFPTTKSDGTPTALVGGVLTVYRDGTTTKSTAGVTLTASLDSVTGLNSFVVDTTADAAFYAPGHDFRVILTAGTVNSVSVVGSPVGSFSIRNRPIPVKSSAFSTSGIHGAGG